MAGHYGVIEDRGWLAARSAHLVRCLGGLQILDEHQVSAAQVESKVGGGHWQQIDSEAAKRSPMRTEMGPTSPRRLWQRRPTASAKAAGTPDSRTIRIAPSHVVVLRV